jgi:hypothetical protein
MRQSRSFDGQMRIVKKKAKSVAAVIALIDEPTKLLAEILIRTDIAKRHHHSQFPRVWRARRQGIMRLPVEEAAREPHKESCESDKCTNSSKD